MSMQSGFPMRESEAVGAELALDAPIKAQRASDNLQPIKLNELKHDQDRANKSPTSDRDRKGTDPPLKTVKQISFRSDDSTHERIHLAARKAGKSVNAWMEENLNEAADDVLGRTREITKFRSRTIQKLVEDAEISGRLAEEIESYLQVWDLRSVFQFKTALGQLLIGIDEVRFFQQDRKDNTATSSIHLAPKDTGRITSLTESLLFFLPPEDRVAPLPFSSALKKLVQGAAAVKPFLKEDKNENILNIVAKVENFLNTLERDHPRQV